MRSKETLAERNERAAEYLVMVNPERYTFYRTIISSSGGIPRYGTTILWDSKEHKQYSLEK